MKRVDAPAPWTASCVQLREVGRQVTASRPWAARRRTGHRHSGAGHPRRQPPRDRSPPCPERSAAHGDGQRWRRRSPEGLPVRGDTRRSRQNQTSARCPHPIGFPQQGQKEGGTQLAFDLRRSSPSKGRPAHSCSGLAREAAPCWAGESGHQPTRAAAELVGSGNRTIGQFRLVQRSPDSGGVGVATPAPPVARTWARRHSRGSWSRTASGMRPWSKLPRT